MKTKLITLLIALTATNVMAENASHHSGQASKHSALAASHGVSGAAEVASAVAAVPVLVSGAVSVGTGSALISAAEHSHQHRARVDAPLVITEKTITIDPAPDQVIVIQNAKTEQ